MSEIVTKKYVKAILSESAEDVNSIVLALSQLAPAFNISKFQNIINLPTLKTTLKVDFIISLVDNPSDKFKNLIKLLAANQRLALIPSILAEIKAKIAVRDGVYMGEIFSSSRLSSDEISSLEGNFSKYFDSKIKLTQADQKYDGIKVSLDDLGVEVSFSMDRLKAQISEYILKAI